MWGSILFVGSMFIFSHTTRKKPVKPKEDFVEARKRRFLQTFAGPNANLNTKDPEESWRRRILMDSTPQGNVLMHYDLFRHTFVYVSDHTIPYRILNACAMKYVQTFFCQDFFRDSDVLPVLSPFTLLEIAEDEREKKETEEKRAKLGICLKGPFLKSKQSSKQRMVAPEAGSYRNKFQYIGKVHNLELLQKPAKKAAPSYKQFKHSYLHLFSTE